MTERRVVMVQLGARRNYIYAHHLEREGLLAFLMTDAAWPSGPRGFVSKTLMTFMPRLDGGIRRRTVTSLQSNRIRSSLLPNLASLAKYFMHEETAYEFIDEALALPNKLRGLGQGDIVINYHGNGGSFLSYAKRRGAKIVTDFIITPKYLEIEDAERIRFPDWKEQRTPSAVISAYRKRMTRLIAISDLYLCPSPSVARDLADLPGFDPARVRLLPYGTSGALVVEPKPALGRVLFAGTAGLRKGLPYLAQAATILKSTRPEISVVVAGEASVTVRSQPETQNLVFLGQLGRDAMSQEFANADVFCLPSLAEGSATSVYEAMAHGLPIVTTASSGSVVRDGLEGLVVSERDGCSIANAIERIVSNRKLRADMSKAAVARAREFSDQACGSAFVSLVRNIINDQPITARGTDGP